MQTQYSSKYNSLTLIYPPYDQVYSEQNHTAFLPQLGLLEILDSIDDIDISTSYIDVQYEENNKSLWLEKKVKLSNLNENDIIGFYTQTSLMPWISDCIKQIRNKNKRVKIIAGGPYVSGVFLGNKTSIQQDKCKELFDYIFCGESEITLRNFLLNRITNDKILYSGRLSSDKIGFPKWQKAAEYIKAYKPAPNWVGDPSLNSLPILLSRGCKRACSFCMSKCIWNSKVVEKQISSIKNELYYFIDLYDLNHLQIWDDDFLLNKNYTEFCKLLGDYSMSYSINTYPNMITYKNALHLKETGCTNVLFGVESLEPEIQKSIGKVINEKELINACKIIKEQGISITLSFIIGFPNETENSINKIKDFIIRNKKIFDYILVNILSLHPGTRVYEQTLKKGYLKESSLVPNIYYKGEPYALKTTSKFPRERLQELQKELTNILL
mgnify:CR=1 FL=1